MTVFPTPGAPMSNVRLCVGILPVMTSSSGIPVDSCSSGIQCTSLSMVETAYSSIYHDERPIRHVCSSIDWRFCRNHLLLPAQRHASSQTQRAPSHYHCPLWARTLHG